MCFWNDKELHTMNGMYGSRPRFQGFGFVRGIVPRALPWAGLDCPLWVEVPRALAELRDALLPNLLSGELRVPAKALAQAGVPQPTRRRLAPRGASLRPTKTVKILFMQTDKVMLKGYANRAFAAHQNRIHPGTCHRFGGDDRQTD